MNQTVKCSSYKKREKPNAQFLPLPYGAFFRNYSSVTSSDSAFRFLGRRESPSLA